MLTYQAFEDELVSRIKKAGKVVVITFIIAVSLAALCWIIIPGGCLVSQGAVPARLVGDGDVPQSACFYEADGIWRCNALVRGE